MNYYQIVGAIITIIGTILMTYGGYLQSNQDVAHKGKVEDYINSQAINDKPNIVALKITGIFPNNNLLVKNNGSKSAKSVKLIFKDSSTPGFFAANLISGTQEIANSTEYQLPLNLFSGYDLLISSSNEEAQREELKKNMIAFEQNNKTFIPRFHLEYYDGDKKYLSDSYYLIVSKARGVEYLGKESD